MEKSRVVMRFLLFHRCGRVLFSVLLSSVLFCGCVAERISPPNIVVILVDDMRWNEAGAAGHPFIQTPNIDRIATEGARFRNAFTIAPLCSPSRASFLTGMYPMTHGITDNLARNEQSHQLKTFPKDLQKAGYETAFIGKWHMGNDDSPRPGFDYWAGMRGQGEALDPFFNINGEGTTIEGYVTDILTDLSLEFVSKERSRPFLLYLSHKALHPNVLQRDEGSTASIGPGGFIAAERHRGMYADQRFPRRPNSGIPPLDKPALARSVGDLPALGPETITPEKTIQERSEMLMAVDEGLGQIMARLEERGVLDQTVIVVTSDHGYWYGEHGLSAERRLAYEEAIRIPLFIRYPGQIDAGVVFDQMVLSIDLAPTVLDLAAVESAAPRPGRSLLELFDGSADEWRQSFLIEYYSDTVFDRIVEMGYEAVRGSRYKYIQYRDLRGMDELYDLENDPYELSNIIGSPDSPELIMEMQRELARLKSQVQ